MIFPDLEDADELTPEQLEKQKQRAEERKEIIALVTKEIQKAKNYNKKVKVYVRLEYEEEQELKRKKYRVESDYDWVSQNYYTNISWD